MRAEVLMTPSSESFALINAWKRERPEIVAKKEYLIQVRGSRSPPPRSLCAQEGSVANESSTSIFSD